MSSNDNNDSQHLLEWVNKERISMEESVPLHSLSQLVDSGFVQAMLYKLDSTFFGGLSA